MFIPIHQIRAAQRRGGQRPQKPNALAAVVTAVTVAIAVAVGAAKRLGADVAIGPGFKIAIAGALIAVVGAVAIIVAMIARRGGQEDGPSGETDAARSDQLLTSVVPDLAAPDAEEQGPIALAVIAAIVAVFAIVAMLMFVSGSAAAQGAPSAEDRGAFAMLRGTDTLVIERFIRTPTALQGALRIKGAPRVEYLATLGPGEMVQSFTLDVWAPGAAADAGPAQHIAMTMHGDTVVAQTPAGTQRIPTRYSAVPVINNSLALTELFTRRARSAGGAGEFPRLAVAGGATITVSVSALAADSMLLTVANQPHRLAVDAIGRITGGMIESQGIRVVRLGSAAAEGFTLKPSPNVETAKPDYSAPPGAPYTAEDVVVPGPNGITLGGTLSKPRGAGPFPAVVTISGSGQQDRDEFIPLAGGVRLFRQIADTLSRRGIVVFRLDDRGVGASTGNVSMSTTADFADDTRAAVAYLRTRKDIDGARIALLGHSEGGMIAPMVAATDAALRAIIVLAGPGSKGTEISKLQNRYAIDQMPSLTTAQRDSMYAAAVRQIDATVPAIPWLKFWWSYDPAPAARRVKAATLIVQGATDRQVPASEAEKLAGLIRAGGNRDVTVRLLPNVNHLFLDDADGNFANYDKLPSNKAGPLVLGTIADWAALKLAAPPPHP